jgi:hypothetical protein
MPYRLLHAFTEGQYVTKYFLPGLIGLSSGGGFMFANEAPSTFQLMGIPFAILALIVTGAATLFGSFIVNGVKLLLGLKEVTLKKNLADIQSGEADTSKSVELIKLVMDDFTRREQHMELREQKLRDEKHDAKAEYEATHLENQLIKRQLKALGFEITANSDIVKIQS